MKKNLLSSLLGLTLMSSLLLIPPAMALPMFSKMFVFGDSLSDIGNVFSLSGGTVPPSTQPELRYYSGQFSNGPVWVDSLAQTMGISDFKPSQTATPADFTANHSIDFAYGGAGTGITNKTPDGLFIVPGLLGQIEGFNSLSEGMLQPMPSISSGAVPMIICSLALLLEYLPHQILPIR